MSKCPLLKVLAVRNFSSFSTRNFCAISRIIRSFTPCSTHLALARPSLLYPIHAHSIKHLKEGLLRATGIMPDDQILLVGPPFKRLDLVYSSGLSVRRRLFPRP